MDTLIVNGGRALDGIVSVHGSKNSVLPILAATILNSGTSVIHNCPKLRDVDAAIEILKYIGCRVTCEDGCVTVDSRSATNLDIPDKMMREMRSSVIFMGAVLARLRRVSLFAPGGCELGARPIDLHISSLKALGALITEEGGSIDCRAGNLRGRDIVLSFPSVGATENTMLAATACTGRTRIVNAAREPEIVDLQNFLVSMGADVSGAGSSTIIINGRKPLHDVEYTVIPDRICAATFMCATALCGGRVRIDNVIPEHVSTLTSILDGIGCRVKVGKDYIDISREGSLSAIRSVRTMPYPGFPTDAQPPLMALASKCKGTSVFVENIFDGRYRHVGGLIRMGADIKLEGKVALVYGVKQLFGCPVEATDLRGGAAMVIAAMAAEGKSEVSHIEHIDRGYENIEKSMSRIGADIKRVIQV
ncbi:MAG: UDP-N-acetylglucosamine 1-carboxyvinyltransferase [Oscillospiraceae bacterium]|nr:UDP-N-acetylglucosamine 1-carboxyvinyltransferase [Oscillospiraceae bacterium]